MNTINFDLDVIIFRKIEVLAAKEGKRVRDYLENFFDTEVSTPSQDNNHSNIDFFAMKVSTPQNERKLKMPMTIELSDVIFLVGCGMGMGLALAIMAWPIIEIIENWWRDGKEDDDVCEE